MVNSQPACQKTDDKGRAQQPARRTQFQLDLRSKGSLPRSESQEKSKREARWWIFFSWGSVWYWLSNMEKSIRKNNSSSHCQMTRGRKTPRQQAGGTRQLEKAEVIGTARRIWTASTEQAGSGGKMVHSTLSVWVLEPKGVKTQTCVTCLLQPLILSTDLSVKLGQKYLPHKSVKIFLKLLYGSGTRSANYQPNVEILLTTCFL